MNNERTEGGRVQLRYAPTDELDIVPDLLPMADPAAAPAAAAAGPPRTLESVERDHIVAVLQQTQGVVDGPHGAGRILGLHPNTLRHRMKKLGITRSSHQIR